MDDGTIKINNSGRYIISFILKSSYEQVTSAFYNIAQINISKNTESGDWGKFTLTMHTYGTEYFIPIYAGTKYYYAGEYLSAKLATLYRTIQNIYCPIEILKI